MLHDLQETAKILGIDRKTLSQYTDMGLISFRRGRGRKRWFTDAIINDFLQVKQRSKASKFMDNNIYRIVENQL